MGNIENSYLLHANFCKNPRPKLRGQYPVCRTHLCDCDMETQEQCVLAWRTCFGCTAKGVTGKNSRDACSLHRHDETQKLLECKYITMPSSAGPSATDGDEARLCGGRQPTQPPEQCKKHCSVIQQHCLIIFSATRNSPGILSKTDNAGQRSGGVCSGCKESTVPVVL